MTFERICAEHETPLIEQQCAYRHGADYECPRWYLTADGIVVAECDVESTRWLRQPFDGGTRKLAGRVRGGWVKEPKPEKPRQRPGPKRTWKLAAPRAQYRKLYGPAA